MECPRCGGTLIRYRLDERETVGCQECAYVGVTVDHTNTRGPPESWDDAIDRFEAQGQSLTVVTRDDLPADVPESELPPEDALVNGVDDERVDDGQLVVPIFEEDVSQPEVDPVIPVFTDGDSEPNGDTETHDGAASRPT